jgi:soluble lytic murein transglycosylase
MIFQIWWIVFSFAAEPTPPVSWEVLMQEGRFVQAYSQAQQQLSGPYTDFYLGWLAVKNKKTEAAQDHFIKASTQSPDIAEYVSLSRGMTYLQLGEYQKALDDFKKAETQARIKYTADVAHFYQAEALAGLKQWKKAEPLYQKSLKRLNKTSFYPSVLWGYLSTQVKNNKTSKTCRFSKELYLKFPAFEKVSDWGIFHHENTVHGQKLNCVVTLDEQRMRVQRLLWAGQEEKAFKEIQDLKKKTESENQYDVDELYVSYLLHEGHVDEALKTLLQYQEEKDNDNDYLMLLGRVYSRTNSPQKGIEAYYRAYQVATKPQLAATALFQSGFASYVVRDYASASAKFKEFSLKYPQHKMSSDSIWFQAWLLYLQKKYPQAEKSFIEIAELKKDKPRLWKEHKEDKINYWLGMSLLRQNKKEEAYEIFTRMTHDESVGYYSVAAYQRVQQLGPAMTQKRGLASSGVLLPNVHENWWLPEAVANSAVNMDEEDKEALQPVPDPFEAKVDAMLKAEEGGEVFPEDMTSPTPEQNLAKDVQALYFNNIEKSLQRSRVLSRIGLWDFAYREVLDAEGKKLTQFQKQWLLQAHQSVHSYNRSVVLASYFFENQAAKLGLHHGTDYWTYSYPKAYEKWVAEQSQKLQVPAEFVWSIMRAETIFRSDAISPVGARGLMQVMPKTGRKLATLMGEEALEVDDLLKPEVSIRYGSFYLQRLLKKFKGNIPLAAAAYNGGPHRVHAWLHYFGDSELDEFIEHIPYLETRNYVKKVTKYYAVYNLLYKKKTNAADFLAKPIGFKMEGSIPTMETWERF